jgi:hypothetical protein
MFAAARHSAQSQSTVDEVRASVAWAQLLFSGSNLGNESTLEQLLSQAAESVRPVFDEQSARDWAGVSAYPKS